MRAGHAGGLRGDRTRSMTAVQACCAAVSVALITSSTALRPWRLVSSVESRKDGVGRNTPSCPSIVTSSQTASWRTTPVLSTVVRWICSKSMSRPVGARARAGLPWSNRTNVPVCLWQTAIDLLDAGAPTTPGGLLHGDFHFGNLFWDADQVSGVIDWAETSWGPADHDVAHLCSDFAMLQGPLSAETFRSTYQLSGGRLTPTRTRRATGRSTASSASCPTLPASCLLYNLAGLTSARRDFDND